MQGSPTAPPDPLRAGSPSGATGGAGPTGGRPSAVGAASDSCVLKLKGLPYSTTQQEILDFFLGFQIRKVEFVLDPDGRPSGLAFAEFESTEEALRAMSMNGKYIGDRYVKLLHVPKQEMVEQVAFGTTIIPSARTRSLVPPVSSGLLPGAGLNMGLGVGVNPQFLDPRMDPRLDPRLANYQQQLMQPQMSVMPGYEQLVGAAAQGFVHSPINDLTKGMQSLHLIQSAPRPHVLTDGSTVKMRGLPFRASKQEVLEFFGEYEMIPDSLHIGVDRLGRPSGEGWITFSNPSEARRAVRDKNRRYLGNRYLELSIC